MAESFLTLRTNGEHYALAADVVSEVIALPPVARVPQAPKGLLGLANLRGAVLPVASLRGLIGAPETADASGERRAIVLDHGAPVALVVDAVEGLVSVDAEQIKTDPAALAAKQGERLKGAFTATSAADAVKILDVGALIDAAFVPHARVQRSRTAVGIAETTVEQAVDERRRLVSFEIAG